MKPYYQKTERIIIERSGDQAEYYCFEIHWRLEQLDNTLSEEGFWEKINFPVEKIEQLLSNYALYDKICTKDLISFKFINRKPRVENLFLSQEGFILNRQDKLVKGKVESHCSKNWNYLDSLPKDKNIPLLHDYKTRGRMIVVIAILILIAQENPQLCRLLLWDARDTMKWGMENQTEKITIPGSILEDADNTIENNRGLQIINHYSSNVYSKTLELRLYKNAQSLIDKIFTTADQTPVNNNDVIVDLDKTPPNHNSKQQQQVPNAPKKKNIQKRKRHDNNENTRNVRRKIDFNDDVVAVEPITRFIGVCIDDKHTFVLHTMSEEETLNQLRLTIQTSLSIEGTQQKKFLFLYRNTNYIIPEKEENRHKVVTNTTMGEQQLEIIKIKTFV